ncbi:MAG: NADH-quinone oxidoreductase subunit NuoG [Aquisalimonadaceae bacterium]
MSEKAEAINPDLVTIEVDGREMQVPKGSMLIEATDNAGINVPRFCYHKKLSIAANCRMCLVDVERAPKPLPACATPVADGMKVSTRSERALKAQKGVMEFLLINHPLDCPICDQGGECELQDVALGYGRGISRFSERKRVVEDEDLGPLIATEMTRCIHCTRCVRFLDEVAGTNELGGMGRGEHTEISTFVGQGVHSEMSGNIIDLCPVGALTSKPYRFTARAWELLSQPSVSAHDSVGSNLQIHHVARRIKRVVPRDNEAINECWLADRDRFGYQGVYSDERLTSPLVRRGDNWETVSWEVALEEAATQLKAVADSDGADMLGALIAGNATLEEQYLAGRLMRGLGSSNIDARLRQVDFSDQDLQPSFPWLGLELESLDHLQAVLLVGSTPRVDQPIVNHRLRKAAKSGGSVMYINPLASELNYDAVQHVVSPDAMIAELAAVAKVLMDQAGHNAPAGFDQLLADVRPGEVHAGMAQALLGADRSAVLLGNITSAHPRAAALRALAGLVAELAGAHNGVLPEAANLAGAWLAGAVPHRQAGGKADAAPGLNARELVERPRKGYLLLSVEPELDCWDGADALAALEQAESVVCITPFVTDTMRRYASVLLPAATFGETSGTFVNTEGRWQSFPGVAAPAGDARPAWKLLRVLANVLNLDGFQYNASDEITEELDGICAAVNPSSAMEWRAPIGEVPVSGGLQRVGIVPLYGVDGVVRRAKALQQTSQARDIGVRVHSAEAKRLKLTDLDWADVTQGNVTVRLPVAIDDGIPEGAVLVPSGIAETAALGPAFGTVTLSRS